MRSTLRRLWGAAWRGLLMGSLFGGWLLVAGWRGGTFEARHGVLEVGAEEVRVVDGDTLLVRGRELRLLGVDAPEKEAPWFEGSQEPWASRAAERARAAIARAGRVRIRASGLTDAYGRELVHAYAGERLLALELLEAGLAYETVRRFGDAGYPELARELVAAARGRPPPFEPPWLWRRRHRVEPR